MKTLRWEILLILVTQSILNGLHGQDRLKVYQVDENGSKECIVEGKFVVQFDSKDSIAENIFANKILPPDSIRRILPEISQLPNYIIREDTVQFRKSNYRKWKGFTYLVYDCNIVFEDKYLSIIDFRVKVDDRTYAVLRAILLVQKGLELYEYDSQIKKKWELSRLIYLYGQMDL
jgi:hypothetical protein